MTTILASMQNSLLVLDSTKDGLKVHEHLKQHNPNSLAYDPKIPRGHTVGLLMPDFGKPMTIVKHGNRPR